MCYCANKLKYCLVALQTQEVTKATRSVSQSSTKLKIYVSRSKMKSFLVLAMLACTALCATHVDASGSKTECRHDVDCPSSYW